MLRKIMIAATAATAMAAATIPAQAIEIGIGRGGIYVAPSAPYYGAPLYDPYYYAPAPYGFYADPPAYYVEPGYRSGVPDYVDEGS